MQFQTKFQIRTNCLFVALTLLSVVLHAQTFNIVKEINTTATLGSIFSPNMATVGNSILYFSDDGIHGLELWKTEGTTSSTQIVKDITPGAGSGIGSSLPQYAVGNGIFYFAALNGAELWRSDGTIAGTYSLKNFGGANRVFQLLFHNGLLYFAANDGTNGIEPWISDGTSTGTVLLKDINPGLPGSLSTMVPPYGFITMGSNVYFAANTITNGNELWKTDGTMAGTVLVKDVFPGSGSSINNMKAAAHNGKIYFAATGVGIGVDTELWATDGTDAGTYRVKDISPGGGSSSPNNLISFNGSLFFSASNNNNNTPGLWKTDGTNAGTVLVRDLAADGVFLTLGFNNNIDFFTVFGNKLFFRGGSSQGLWVSDGTTAGTILVKQVGGGGELISFNNQIYFQGSGVESFNSSTLYKSDGTSGGTVPVFEGDLLSSLTTLTITKSILNSKLFFVGNNRTYGSEVWSTDGTSAGTNLLKDLNKLKAGTQTGSQNIAGSVFLNGMFLFTAADDTHGVELWKTDGTLEGTVMIKDIFPGAGSSNPAQFCVVEDQVFFIANNGTTGGELWKTDGTAAGTLLVKDINPGSANGPYGYLTASGPFVYFTATHPDTGYEMWRSNGTEAGTVLVSDLTPGTGSGFSVSNTHLTFANKAFFIHGTSNKLYVGDGTGNTFTEFSTNIIAAYDMAAVGNTFFIGGRNASGQNVLWRSDNGATPIQYKILRNTDGGTLSMFQFTNCKGKLFFNANDGTSGNEPWVSDGTETGTFRIKDIQAGSGNSQPFHFTASGDKVFFQARITGSDSELWATDGTEAGTYLVKDINPGPTGSNPSAFLPAPGGKVLFTANNGVNGIELWESNGTESGTKLLRDFNSNGNGLASLNTALHFKDNFVLWPLNNGIIFFARSAENGQQLYFGSFQPQVLYVNDGSTTGDTLTTAIGNDNNPGTSEAPFATIQHAVNEATDGAVIYVDAGIYTEQVSINKALTIKGAGQGITILNGPSTPLVGAPGFIGEPGIIQGFADVDSVKIQDLTIDGTQSNEVHSILIQGTGIVSHCEMRNANNGIYFRPNDGRACSAVAINNHIHDINYVGINISGSGMDATVNGNTINLSNALFGMGFIVGNPRVLKFTAQNNAVINHNGFGFSMDAVEAYITRNSITGTSGNAINNDPSANVVNANCNWYGVSDANAVAAKLGGPVNFTPWLLDGTDADTLAFGFQPLPDACFGGRAFYVNDNSTVGDVFTSAIGNDANPGTASAPFATITQAFDVAPSGSAIFVDAGLYDFAGAQSFLTKPISFFGANYQISPNDSSNASQPNEERNAETIVKGLQMRLLSPNITLKGFTFEPGNVSLFVLENNGSTSNDFGGFTFEKNILKITPTNNNRPHIELTGKFTDDGVLPITSGFTIADNRFEATNGFSANTILLNYIKNVVIHNNVFMNADSAGRSLNAVSIGINGVADSVNFTHNRIDQAHSVVTGTRIAHLTMKENWITNSTLFFESTNSFAGSTEIILENNQIENTKGGAAYIFYNRAGPANNWTYNRFQLKGNTFISNPFANFPSYANLFLTVNNVVPNMQTLISGNTITYSGNFSDIPNQYIRPITLQGNVGKVDIFSNEITLNNSGTTLPTLNFLLPTNPAIHIGPDNGPTAYMTGNAEINIHNNKIQGYKQGVVVYDWVNNGHDAFTGYGNLPGGTTFNVTNNSFVGDSISINNGDSSQVINAGCNWYGTANTTQVANKVSRNTVRYAPFLINGNDLSDGTGFQPAPGSCASITGFMPAEGMEGAVVVITGEGLSGATGVAFNGKASTSISATTDSTLVATVPQGATTGTVSVTTPIGTVVSAINFFVIPSPVADTTGVCPGSNGLLISQVKGTTYQWQVFTNGTYVNITDGQHYFGTQGDTLRLLEIPTDWNGRTFRCVVNGAVNNKTFTLQVANYWSGGGNSTSWSNPLNWGCSGQVPDENTNVIINSGAVILTEAATAKSIWVSPGASFTVQPGVILIINQQ